jgi:hypothetical protein
MTAYVLARGAAARRKSIERMITEQNISDQQPGESARNAANSLLEEPERLG